MEQIARQEVIENNFNIEDIDNTNIEDTAFTYINLAKSYNNRGLFSQAAEYFSKALELENSNLNFEYYYNFILEDIFDSKEILNALKPHCAS